MQSYYDWIYLAPHLDDAALSCGGQIFRHTQAGQAVLIVTAMAGDPPAAALSGYAASLHARWALATEASAARRAEDIAACAILGADYLHWSVPDCIYRHDPVTGAALYVSDDDIFGAVAVADRGLEADLAAQIAALPAHGRLVAPLTVGHHVDHLLLRAAAERGRGAAHLRYYEDYPYAQQEGALAAALGSDAQGWATEVFALDAAALAAKVEAILAFRSQLSTFFVDRADLEAQVQGYAAQTGGERLWRRTGV
jgi:LmbE family N-acetylglucosaminyl deacetylase